MEVEKGRSEHFNEYAPPRTTVTNRGEKTHSRESFSWRNSPQYDPNPKPLDKVPEEVRLWMQGEEFVWESTAHLPGFKEDVLEYWASCLALAREPVRTFALSLDLPENYFDSRTTYPGADGVTNFYRPVIE